MWALFRTKTSLQSEKIGVSWGNCSIVKKVKNYPDSEKLRKFSWLKRIFSWVRKIFWRFCKISIWYLNFSFVRHRTPSIAHKFFSLSNIFGKNSVSFSNFPSYSIATFVYSMHCYCVFIFWKWEASQIFVCKYEYVTGSITYYWNQLQDLVQRKLLHRKHIFGYFFDQIFTHIFSCMYYQIQIGILGYEISQFFQNYLFT